MKLTLPALPACVVCVVCVACVAGVALAQHERSPTEDCFVQVGNRLVPVQADGYWEAIGIPAAGGLFKARLHCTNPYGTRRGASGFFGVSPNTTTAIPSVPFSPPPREPQRLILTGPSVVTGPDAGALGVSGAFADGAIEALTEGTTFVSSDASALAVDAAGGLAALRSGRVFVSVSHSGITSGLRIDVLLGGDTDNDGLPDDWEIAVGLDPSDPLDAGADLDGDGLDNRAEFDLGSDPLSADPDGDGILDPEEVVAGADGWITLPRASDTDGDALPDDVELLVGSDPTDPQSADYGAAVLSLEVSPKTLTFGLGVFGDASPKRVRVIARLVANRTAEVTTRAAFSTSPAGVVELTDTKGEIQPSAPGVAVLTAAFAGRDVSVPIRVFQTAVQPLGRLDLPGDTYDVALFGDHAYLPASAAGLVVASLASPTTPVVVATLAVGTARDVTRFGARIGVATEGGVALVSAAGASAAILLESSTSSPQTQVAASAGLLVSGGPAGVRAFDASLNPAGHLDTTAVRGLAASGTTVAYGLGRSLAVATHTGSELTSRSALQLGRPVLAVELSGDTAFVALDLPVSQILDHTLAVVDLKDPGAPVLLSRSGLGDFLLRDSALVGTTLYGAEWLRTNAAVLLDTAAPGAPAFVAQADFSPLGDADGWGVDASPAWLALVAGTPTPRTLYVSRSTAGGATAPGVQPLPPTVVLTAPGDGRAVRRNEVLTLQAFASDDGGVALLRFRAAGEPVGEAFGSAASVVWTAPNDFGTVVLTAEALDFDGNLTTSGPVQVFVLPDTDPPLVTLSAPLPGVTVFAGASFAAAAVATDNSFVRSTRLLVDGEVRHEADGASASALLKAPNTPGTLTVSAAATDQDGNSGTSPGVMVTVIPVPTTTCVGRVVTAANAAVPGATVAVGGLTGSSATDGSFSVTGIPALSGLVVAVTPPEGSGLSSLSVGPVTPVPNGVTDVGNVVLEAAGARPLRRSAVVSPPVRLTFAAPSAAPATHVDDLIDGTTLDMDTSTARHLPGTPGLATSGLDLVRPLPGGGGLGAVVMTTPTTLLPGIYEYESLTVATEVKCPYGDVEIRVKGDFYLENGNILAQEGSLTLIVGGKAEIGVGSSGGIYATGDLSVFLGTLGPQVHRLEEGLSTSENGPPAGADFHGSSVVLEVVGDLYEGDQYAFVGAGSGRGSGFGGDATVRATGVLDLSEVSSGGSYSPLDNAPFGKGGSTRVTAGGDVHFESVWAGGSSQGLGGDLVVSATGDMVLENAWCDGNGDVHVTAGGNVTLYNTWSEHIDNTSGLPGGSGSVRITAFGDALFDNVWSGSTIGGPSGSVQARVGGRLSLGYSWTGDTMLAGDTGDLDLQAGELVGSGGNWSGAATGGAGAGGDVILRAPRIAMEYHQAYAGEGDNGTPGSLLIEGDVIRLTYTRLYTNRPETDAPSGAVVVRASDTLALLGTYVDTGYPNCPWSHPTGDITLDAGRTFIAFDSTVESGPGGGWQDCALGASGDVTVRAGTTLRIDPATVLIRAGVGEPAGVVTLGVNQQVNSPNARVEPALVPDTVSHLVSRPIDTASDFPRVELAELDLASAPSGATALLELSSAPTPAGPYSPWTAVLTTHDRFLRWRVTLASVGLVGPFVDRVRLRWTPQSCEAIARPCNDQSACTTDTCAQAGCTYTILPCLADGDSCTRDHCDPALGCVHTPDDCDDEDPCTTDTCGTGGCEHAAVAGCCRSALDCPTTAPCRQAYCGADHLCHDQPAGPALCCTSAADCPSDPCGVSTCEFGRCSGYQNSFPCCTQSLRRFDFASGDHGFETRAEPPTGHEWKHQSTGWDPGSPGSLVFKGPADGEVLLRAPAGVTFGGIGVTARFRIRAVGASGQLVVLARVPGVLRALPVRVGTVDLANVSEWTQHTVDLPDQGPFQLEWRLEGSPGDAGIALDDVEIENPCLDAGGGDGGSN